METKMAVTVHDEQPQSEKAQPFHDDHIHAVHGAALAEEAHLYRGLFNGSSRRSEFTTNMGIRGQ